MSRGRRFRTGPYLVVGLARSGAAAARMLRAHGEVIGVDTRPAGGARRTSRPQLESDGLELLERAANRGEEPGRAAGGAGDRRRARERGLAVVGELELAWRLLPNRVRRRDRHERQDDHGRAARRDLARRAGCRWPWPATSARRCPRSSGEVDAGRDGRLRGVELPARGRVGVRARVRGAAEPRADHLDRHGDFEAYRDAKLRMFANQAPDARRRRAAGFELPGAARRVRLGRRCRWRRTRSACAARTTSRTRWRAARRGAGARACRRTAVARGAARRSRACRTGSRRWPSVDGVLYVNDSKATNVASAARGIEAFDGGVHVILGGSLKGGGFEGLREAVAARCRAGYLIGEAAERLAADLERHGVPLHRCGDLERAVERGRARRPSRARWCCSRRPARSYDQFRDFEERGEHFRALVLALDDFRRGASKKCRMARAPPASDPLEYSILYTATLCLLAAGRGDGLLGELGGVAAERLGRPVLLPQALRDVRAGRAGRAAPRLAPRPEADQGAHAAAAGRLVRADGAVMLPGFGVTVNGATRWLGAGPLQFQPSELLKLSLVLYAAQLLAARPSATKTLGGLFKPLLLVVGAALRCCCSSSRTWARRW